MRVAVYVRVSTRDKDQNPDTQILPLREYARAQGWEVVWEHVDMASALDLPGRTAWRELLKDARLRRFDLMVVLRLDRAFRSMADLHHVLEGWQPLGIHFVSLREGFDTETASGRLIMNFLAAFGEFELSLVCERIADGLARARSRGKRLGRPPGIRDSRPRRKSGGRLQYALKARAEGR